MQRKRISLRAVARELNISAMTLYRVLNNAPGVSDATRQRVIGVLDKAGILQSVQERPQTVIFDIQRDPYKSRRAFHLLTKIVNLDYKILFSNHKTDKASFLQMCDNADTVVFFSSPTEEILQDVKRANPDIFRINVFGGKGGDLAVDVDDFYGGQLAAKYFYEKGHRNLAVATIPVEPTQLNRHKSFIGELSYLAPDGKVFPLLFRETWEDLGERLLYMIREQGVTGVFCTCDHVGYQLQCYLHKNGISVPDEFSILAYDVPENGVQKRIYDIDRIAFDQDTVIRGVEYHLVNRQIRRTDMSAYYLITPELVALGSVKKIL
jgi:LacI family transcriptional regulator